MGEKIIVVGSGPASVACARALVDKGMEVTMLDAGVDLEPARQELVDRMRVAPFEGWGPESIAVLKESAGATTTGLPMKRLYGSDFPYREVPTIQAERATTFSSFARGGLSNVWGAAVLPYLPTDISDWAIAPDALSEAYKAVFKFVPLSAKRDDLEEMFPLHSETYAALRPSRQAEDVLETMNRHRDRLRERGFVFGTSRVAVQAEPTARNAKGCTYCGLCMYGCPYDLIYKSPQSLDATSDKIHYVPNVVVDRVEEIKGKVVVHAHGLHDKNPLEYKADRVFLGCGVLQTAKVMLQSLDATSHALTLRDSQYFLLPVVGLRGGGNAQTERLHTLSQLFLELVDHEISAHPVHMQMYTYNDLYLDAMKSMLGSAFKFALMPAGLMLSRLMVLQGYLHSNLSPTGTVSLRDGHLHVEQNEIPKKTTAIVSAVVGKLTRNSKQLGFMPIAPMLKTGHLGTGAHSGGTFPMRGKPGRFETDTLGRPSGFKRLHLIDSSVLPSIPATTITLSVMANAYRIGGAAYGDQ